ncbi:MAG: ABC transporter permease [Candidatus Gracilibacteria bacterium]
MKIKFSTYLSLSYSALKANKIRTLLTTLGIVIGVITVIMVFALGHSTEAVVNGQMEAYGANTIFVETKVPGFSDTSPGSATAQMEGVTVTTLKEDDMKEALSIPGVTGGYGVVIGQERVTSLYDDKKYMIQGTSAAFIDIDQSEVAEGRYFTDSEDQGMSRVAVIGNTVAEELFPDVDPIGQSVRISGINFKIIGVMEKLGVVFFQDMDKQIYVPLNTMQKLVLGIDHIPYFVIQVESDSVAIAVKDDIISMLDQRHNISKPDRRDFRVSTMEEAMAIMGTITGALQILLIVLAVISLIVGGVGVMNIMFVTVTERTREIGLRKALGATPEVILTQFLFESSMITFAGALIGVGIAVSLVMFFVIVASYVGVDLGLYIPINGILISVAAAIFEGIAFGLYPAKKAAGLNPIESLRYE